MSHRLKVLWLTDHCTGHKNNSRGILQILSMNHDLDIEEFPVRWWFPPARHLLGRCGKAGLKLPLKLFLKSVPVQKHYDLIVSAGGFTQWPNAAIAQRNSIPNVFSGSPRQFPLDLFRVIPYQTPGDSPFLHIEFVPSVVSPDAAREAARTHLPEIPGNACCVLIGGDCGGFRWTRQRWQNLAEKLVSFSAQYQRPLLIATSRRTTLAGENILRNILLPSGCVMAADWYFHRETPPPPLMAYLGAAEKIFVTVDSVSMMFEAICSGRPVVALTPDRFPKISRLETRVDQQENRGRITRFLLNSDLDLETVAPPGGWNPISFNPHQLLADQLWGRLQPYLPNPERRRAG